MTPSHESYSNERRERARAQAHALGVLIDCPECGAELLAARNLWLDAEPDPTGDYVLLAPPGGSIWAIAATPHDREEVSRFHDHEHQPAEDDE